MAEIVPRVFRRISSPSYKSPLNAAVIRAAGVPGVCNIRSEPRANHPPLPPFPLRFVRINDSSRERNGDYDWQATGVIAGSCGVPRLAGPAATTPPPTRSQAPGLFAPFCPPRTQALGVFDWVRYFGIRRVVQKRRYQMRILHPAQTPYKHYEEGTRPPPIPHSITATGTIRKLLYTNSIAAREAASRVNWEAYISHKKGVRWHRVGGWRVQFSRTNHERNFFVRCDCYFKVKDYGFETAKELAYRYRERLEKEWEELEKQWTRLDIQEARARMRSRTGVEIEHPKPLALPDLATGDGMPNTDSATCFSTVADTTDEE